MLTASHKQRLQQAFPTLAWDEPLSRHCTIRVGGPAAAFLVTRTTQELVAAIGLARELGISWHILGGGSNTLFADTGFDGLVIKNLANQMTIAGQAENLEAVDWTAPIGEVRHESADPMKYVSFLDLNYAERPGDTIVVAEAGINLTALIVRTLDAGLTGLEWYGGIPGVIGGAVYNNIHGGTHLIAERVSRIVVLDENNQQQELEKKELDFGYDYSRLHQTGEIILAVHFLLTQATGPETERAEQTFREWVRRKTQMQPKLGSMGSTFQNIAQEVRGRIGAPTTSAGWLIDQAGLKGKIIGQAQIAPEHANFIVNLGGATANDVYSLIRLAQKTVKQKFGVDLTPEVFLVGDFPDV